MAEPANANYVEALSLAKDQNMLLPIAGLCNSFPPEMSRILLAYAESESFTRFIVNKYGDSGLVNLTQAYSDGLDCQQGPVRALGISLDQLERDWLTSKGATPPSLPANAISNALADLLPYLALLGMMFIVPLGFIAANWRKTNGRDHA
jgi:hypothetical protein